jgi:hypothetical protein
VPTTDPAGNSPSTIPSRATSASRGSSRRGTAAITNLSSGAVGKSLYECTAMSTVPSAIASRSAAVKTPTPISATGSLDLSPAVAISTSSAWRPLASIAALMMPAWVVASRLPLVPIRMTASRELVGKRLLGPVYI